jgi:flavin-dependent dehydrogenase
MIPLVDGQTIAVIGGGPGGIACALALQRDARRLGRSIEVLVFEPKRFDVDHNQCAGVLSPPLQRILRDEFEIELPPSLIQREILGYVLHAGDEQLTLDGQEYGGASLAVRRSEFDAYLASCAQARGVTIIPTSVTDLEFHPDGVLVFTWSGTYRAAAVVGAFGVGQAIAAALARQTAYHPPPLLDAVITKIHPPGDHSQPIPNLLGNYIHVTLPPLPRVEFGAVIPKGNHITIIAAGRGVGTTDMDALLALPAIRRLLPEGAQPEGYYKGYFPVGLARGMVGERYVTIGDAAGLVRPFKGKGVNSAVITGMLAARTLLEEGVSARALHKFCRGCRDITGDILYGTLVRRLAWLTAHHLSVAPILRHAAGDPALRELLFDCVSGRETFRRIVLRKGNLPLAVKLGMAALAERLRNGRVG